MSSVQMRLYSLLSFRQNRLCTLGDIEQPPISLRTNGVELPQQSFDSPLSRGYLELGDDLLKFDNGIRKFLPSKSCERDTEREFFL